MQLHEVSRSDYNRIWYSLSDNVLTDSYSRNNAVSKGVVDLLLADYRKRHGG